MKQDGLNSIEHDGATVTLRYERGTDYDLGEIIEYVEDMSDKTSRIAIYEGGVLVCDLRLNQDGWADVCKAM